MRKFSITTDIAAPAERVWQVYLAFEAGGLKARSEGPAFVTGADRDLFLIAEG